ncbi:MAG: proton-conducting transporter membrane subunit [Fuerstiella sp.]
MQELHLPWLELSVIVPLIGAVITKFIRNSNTAYRFSVGVCSLTLCCAVGEWIDFGTLQTFEAFDHWDLLHGLFKIDLFVIDELSAPLLPLTALLYLMTVLSTLRTKMNRFSFPATLVSEALLLATLSSRDPFVIILLCSAAVIPPWFEIKRRGHCTRVFSFHMGLFVALMFGGWLLLPDGTMGHPEVNSSTRGIIAGALLTAAALLRSGIVPVHCWMTDLFEKATMGTALLFVTPMTGAYVVMRIVLPIAPSWALQSIALVSLTTSVYAAGMALVQTDSRRFFCYLFLSHSSLVLVGLELLTPIGLTGALCVWISVGLAMGGFGLTMRSVEARIGRFSLAEYRGLYEHTPTLASLFLLTGLASIGFPGTIGFIGTELLVEGAVEVYPYIGMTVVIAAALNSIAVMHAYFRIFTGTRYKVSVPVHVRPAERFAVLILAALILGGGLWPQPGVASRFHAAQALIQLRHPSEKTATPNTSAQPQHEEDDEELPAAEVHQEHHALNTESRLHDFAQSTFENRRVAWQPTRGDPHLN